jgi:hypothetical protein
VRVYAVNLHSQHKDASGVTEPGDGKSRHGDRCLVMHACLLARRTLGCLDQGFAFWVDMKHLEYQGFAFWDQGFAFWVDMNTKRTHQASTSFIVGGVENLHSRSQDLWGGHAVSSKPLRALSLDIQVFYNLSLYFRNRYFYWYANGGGGVTVPHFYESIRLIIKPVRSYIPPFSMFITITVTSVFKCGVFTDSVTTGAGSVVYVKLLLTRGRLP